MFSAILFYLISTIVSLLIIHHSGLLFLLIANFTGSTPPEPTDFNLPYVKRRHRPEGYTAVVFGASGGIGRQIVAALKDSAEITNVKLLLRKENKGLPSTGKFEQVVVNFEEIEDSSHLLKGVDFAFYALGVYAGFVSEEEYLKVERDGAKKIAKIMKEEGIPEVHWVTAIGVSDTSPFLFGKIKAEVEKAVGKLGFDRVAFYRPGGVLTPDNSGLFGETRIKLMRYLDIFRLLTVDGDSMGKVMVSNALRQASRRVEVYTNRNITRYFKAYCNQ